MLIIQSYFDNEKFSIRTKHDLVVRQADLSCKFLKKHGYDIVLYTTDSLKDNFLKCKYDNIVSLNDIYDMYNNIDLRHFWSGTKLISMTFPNQRFYHIDMDIFLIEDVLKDYNNNNCLMLHVEPWMKMLIKNNTSTSLIKFLFNIDLDGDFYSYNAAVFGGQNIKDIQTNILSILNTINTTKNIKNIFTYHSMSSQSVLRSSWLPSVLFEQVLLPNSIGDISTVINTSSCRDFWNVFDVLKKHNIIHLWNAKRNLDSAIGINRLCDYIEKYYLL